MNSPVRVSLASLRQPPNAALIALSALASVLVAAYLIWVRPLVEYPGDFLIWSESDFVNDIIKFRLHYPLYTAQVNNESFPYPPGSQLLTYLFAWATGHGLSVAAYRFVQLLFALAAAFVTTLTCRRLAQLRGLAVPKAWDFVWFPCLFLVATNSLTNPYIYNLHNDSLAQLVCAAAFLLLIDYLDSRRTVVLVLMGLVPALGFLVKQSLVIWLILFAGAIAAVDRRRAVRFAVAAASGVAVVMGLGVAMAGQPFVYWVFEVLGKHRVSPARSLQHALQAWPYYALLIAAALLLPRGKNGRILTMACGVAFLLLLTETYTSGVAWMINHMGPGCLLAATCFFASMPVWWNFLETHARPRWFGFAACVALCGLVFYGLGMVRVPLPALSPDSLRYAQEIENQFKGMDASAVLLDAGSWVYLRDGVVMKDRAPCIGERGYSQTGDFSGILDRLRHRRYQKILLRNYHSGDFWYDHAGWPRSSGIREALAANYREVGTIRAVSMPPWSPDLANNYLFSEITILAPISEFDPVGAYPT